MNHSALADQLFDNPSLVRRLNEYFNKDQWSVTTTQFFLKTVLVEALTTRKGDAAVGEDKMKATMDPKHSRQALDNDLMASIKATAESHRRDLTWDDVAGLQNAKQELQIAVEMPRKQPQLFSDKLKPCQFILLYGPPGTGKTHLARVLAAVTKSTPYILSTSDTTNMWVGNSARLVRLMFEQARANKPAIIFFDEVDATCGLREHSHTESHIEQKSELLAQMDGAKEDNTDVLFIGATNLPWNIDPAFLRRFEKKLYIPLPDAVARGRMLEIELGSHVPQYFQKAKHQIIEMTEGFSGSDIKRLVQETLQVRLREIESATHFWYKSGCYWTSSNYEHPDVKPMSWREIPEGKLRLWPPALTDFEHGLKKVKPSVGLDSLEEFEEWSREHGTD